MASDDCPYRIMLDEDELPSSWYNIQADLPVPAPPPLHPVTREPCTPDDLTPLFPMSLIMQEVSTDPHIEIPEEVLEVYKLYRPTPLKEVISKSPTILIRME